MSDPYVPPALFVTWQDPTSRIVYPVGRLARLTAPRSGYEFAYLRAALEAKAFGFAPFIGFSELATVYHSTELPPFFENRVLTRGRPEYPVRLAELGLDATATPVDILARTNGRRATDSYEVFAEFEPSERPDEWETRFFVRSLRYLELPEVVARLNVGQRLLCMRDIQNDVDGAALALRTETKAMVGMCPAYLVADLDGPLRDDPHSVVITIGRINPEPAPLQNRIQCHLRLRTAGAFHAYRQGRFEPISPEAIRLRPWVKQAKVA
jgi:hypothetical protein